MSIEFLARTRNEVLPLQWIRPDGNLAFFTWGRTALWDEGTALEWLAHLGQTISDSAEPVAGIPGPVAHLISGFRLSASECWKPDREDGPGVIAVAVFHDAGRLFVVTAGTCRMFRARGRHEIFLTEPPYSEMETGLSEVALESTAEAVMWGQELPRPGDVYLVAAGVEGEPKQGLKHVLFDVDDDFAPPLEYCRGVLLAGMAQESASAIAAASRPSRAVQSRASAAILKAAGAPLEPPAVAPVEVQPRAAETPAPAVREPEPQAQPSDIFEDDLALAVPGPQPSMRRGAARGAGIVALVALAAFTAWWSLGRSTFGWKGAPWNPGTLAISTEPPNAHISVDGHGVGASPVRVNLKPGRHFIEARLADLGVDTSSVWLKAGDVLSVTPRFAGTVAVSNLHPGLGLFAQLDGAPADSVPVVWKNIPAGRHLVSFSGPGVLPWTAEIRVARGQTTDYAAEPQTTDTRGTLRVASIVVTDQGRKDGRGDPVRVDSRPAGRTPLQMSLESGTHSVRVDHANADGQTQLVDVKPGQDRFVTVDFDGARRAWIELVTPAGATGGGIIAAAYHPAHGETVREMRLLFAAPSEPYFTRRIMTPLDRSRGIFAAPLPHESQAGGGWRYYVEAVDDQFNETPTEIVSVGRAPRPVAVSTPKKSPAPRPASTVPAVDPIRVTNAADTSTRHD